MGMNAFSVSQKLKKNMNENFTKALGKKLLCTKALEKLKKKCKKKLKNPEGWASSHKPPSPKNTEIGNFSRGKSILFKTSHSLRLSITNWFPAIVPRLRTICFPSCFETFNDCGSMEDGIAAREREVGVSIQYIPLLEGKSPFRTI